MSKIDARFIDYVLANTAALAPHDIEHKDRVERLLAIIARRLEPDHSEIVQEVRAILTPEERCALMPAPVRAIPRDTEADAARYRWLRENFPRLMKHGVAGRPGRIWAARFGDAKGMIATDEDGPRFDDAVDDAMKRAAVSIPTAQAGPRVYTCAECHKNTEGKVPRCERDDCPSNLEPL